jgi:hypothetical protein
VYSSEEAKIVAESQAGTPVGTPVQRPSTPASLPPSSPGRSPEKRPLIKALTQISSEDSAGGGMARAESEPALTTLRKEEKKDEVYYAKTLRLTSEQLVYNPLFIFVSFWGLTTGEIVEFEGGEE